jgi:hypothetical protein
MPEVVQLKATVDLKARNQTEGLLNKQFFLEERLYRFSNRPNAYNIALPDKERIEQCHKAIGGLRSRLSSVSKFPESPRKRMLLDAIYKRIDFHYQIIFHERDPANYRDPKIQYFGTPGKPDISLIKTIQLLPPLNEEILISAQVTGTHD